MIVNCKVFDLKSGNTFYYFTFNDISYHGRMSLPHGFIAKENQVIDCYCGRVASEKLEFYSKHSLEKMKEVDLKSFDLSILRERLNVFNLLQFEFSWTCIVNDQEDASSGSACNERRWFYRFVGCQQAYSNIEISKAITALRRNESKSYLLLFIIGTLKYVSKEGFSVMFNDGNWTDDHLMKHTKTPYNKKVINKVNGSFLYSKYMNVNQRGSCVRACGPYFRSLLQYHRH